MRKLFKGGIHPQARKELTENCAVRVMPLPTVVAIPLSQHIGKPAKAIVSVGDKVKKGTLIAQADGVISANVYSSVSGEVTAIELRRTPNGSCEHIVVKNDGENAEERLEPIETLTSENIIDRVNTAGIVGMGGAGFPVAVKLNPPTTVDTLIINAAECEPYVTCDTRVMIDYTDEFLDGVFLLALATKVKRTIIAVEDNKPQAIKKLREKTSERKDEIEVVVLKTLYPQGSEKHIIKSATGRVVPAGALPASVGVVVCNVHTALSTHYAVREGKPLYERITTVTGDGITNPCNIWVANGTQYNEVIDFCGGLKENVRVVKMINGGPMMGTAVSGGNLSTTKTTGCLLLMSDKEANTDAPSACINCARCVKACPMGLMPMYVDAYSRSGDLDGAVKYGLNACIECGSCAFVCPAKRTLTQSFKIAKKQLRGRKN